jgi:hypothetical protein
MDWNIIIVYIYDSSFYNEEVYVSLQGSKDNMVRWPPIPGKVIGVILRVIHYWKIYDISKADPGAEWRCPAGDIFVLDRYMIEYLAIVLLTIKLYRSN